MNELEQSLTRIAKELTDLKQSFALVGGLAVSSRAEPRMTRDADLAVAVANDEAAELLIYQLRQIGYVVDTIVEDFRANRLSTVRLTFPDDRGLVVDLLFASSGIEDVIAASASILAVLPGCELPVATVGHLIAMKLLARDDRHRPADADDLRALAEVASEHDWAQASNAIALITHRGFHRNRDLGTALQILRQDGAF